MGAAVPVLAWAWDEDGDPLDFAWSVVSTEPEADVSLAGQLNPAAYVSADAAVAVTLEVRVTDATESATARTTVTFEPGRAPEPADAIGIAPYVAPRLAEVRIVDDATGEAEVAEVPVIGDLVVIGDVIVGRLEPSGDFRPQATVREDSALPSSEIPYVFTEGKFAEGERQFIRDALDEIAAQTVVTFTEHDATRPPDAEHLRFSRGELFVNGLADGCWAEKNQLYAGVRVINLSCAAAARLQNLGATEARTAKATVMHEVLHALGLYHEHQRGDRERYIDVTRSPSVALPHNLASYQLNFAIPSWHQRTDWGPYDFRSIMHYPLGDYGYVTMSLAEGADLPDGFDAAQVGRVTDLSAGDVAAIDRLYGNAVMTVSPSEVTVSTEQGAMVPVTLQLVNGGTLPIALRSVTTDVAWATASWPGSATIPVGSAMDIDVRLDADGVPAGRRDATIGIRWEAAGEVQTAHVPVRIDVAMPPSEPPTEPVLESLTVELSGDGSGRVASNPAGIDCGETCEAMFPEGATVVLSAVPDLGSVLSGWGGDNDCSDGRVTMSDPRSCTAHFDLAPPTAPVIEDATGPGDGSSGDTFRWSARVRDADSDRSALNVTVHVFGNADGTNPVGIYPLSPSGDGNLADGLLYAGEVALSVPSSTRLYWQVLVDGGGGGDRHPASGFASFRVEVDVAPLPNLVLENAYLVPANPVEGDSVDFCVTWRNAGDGTAALPADGSISVSRAFLDGATSARFSNAIWFAEIPAGDSWEDCVDPFGGDPATPGSHTIYAYTDADQEIDESNESDNRLTFAFDVAAAPINAAPRITDLWAEQQGDVYACGSMIPDNDTTSFHWTASDPDGDTLAYDWRMDGEPWTRQSATYESEMISDYGDHTFDVRAVDPSGATSPVRSCTVNASDPPEIFGFDGPGINETATVGSPTTFVMNVRDPDDHYPSEAVLYIYDPYQRIEMTRYLDGGADTRVTYVASVTFSASGPRRYSMVVIDALGVAGDSTGFIDFTVYP